MFPFEEIDSDVARYSQSVHKDFNFAFDSLKAHIKKLQPIITSKIADLKLQVNNGAPRKVKVKNQPGPSHLRKKPIMPSFSPVAERQNIFFLKDLDQGKFRSESFRSKRQITNESTFANCG